MLLAARLRTLETVPVPPHDAPRFPLGRRTLTSPFPEVIMFKKLLFVSCTALIIGGCQCRNSNVGDGGTGGGSGADGSTGGGSGGGGGMLPDGGLLPDGGMCVAAGQPCGGGETCCAGQCNGTVCTSSTFCRDPGGACTIDTDCCNNNCVSGQCGSAACVATGSECLCASHSASDGFGS